MHPSCCSSARRQTLTVLCFQIMCLVGLPLISEAARLRCGSELLSDLIFVCGDRGIYLGKGTWSGYGARPRGKGIVEQCCRPAGCELQHLEKYCAKPKSQQKTTMSPATTTAIHTTTSGDMAQQFEVVFHKRLAQHLGAPNSPKKDAYRKKPAVQQKGRKRPMRGPLTS